MNMTRALGLATLAGLTAVSFGQSRFFAATDLASYEMTMTRYNTLADAQAGVNAVSTHTLSDPVTNNRRDLGTFFVQDTSTYAGDHAVFLTAWYYTTEENTNGQPKDSLTGDRRYSGWGNPNNTNTGFVQMYDVGASTVSSMSAIWSVLNVGVAGGSTFTMSASGTNAGAAEFARLWHGGLGGAASLTRGTFVSWEFDMTAAGLTANWDPTHMLYTSSNHPASVSGSFSGIFENTGSDPSFNGFYVFSASLNETSWAFAQGDAALNGDFFSSEFGAVPEPATMSVVGLAALAAWRKRRKS